MTGRNRKDSCKLIYFPGDILRTTNQLPLPGSSTFRYNISDINVIPAENLVSENENMRENSEYSQDIVSKHDYIWKKASEVWMILNYKIL